MPATTLEPAALEFDNPANLSGRPFEGTTPELSGIAPVDSVAPSTPPSQSTPEGFYLPGSDVPTLSAGNAGDSGTKTITMAAYTSNGSTAGLTLTTDVGPNLIPGDPPPQGGIYVSLQEVEGWKKQFGDKLKYEDLGNGYVRVVVADSARNLDTRKAIADWLDGYGVSSGKGSEIILNALYQGPNATAADPAFPALSPLANPLVNLHLDEPREAVPSNHRTEIRPGLGGSSPIGDVLVPATNTRLYNNALYQGYALGKGDVFTYDPRENNSSATERLRMIDLGFVPGQPDRHYYAVIREDMVANPATFEREINLLSPKQRSNDLLRPAPPRQIPAPVSIEVLNLPSTPAERDKAIDGLVQAWRNARDSESFDSFVAWAEIAAGFVPIINADILIDDMVQDSRRIGDLATLEKHGPGVALAFMDSALLAGPKILSLADRGARLGSGFSRVAPNT